MGFNEDMSRFEEDIKIDESALDVEWLRQPELMLKYSVEVAQCKKRLDLLKERFDVIVAEFDREIRSNPEKFGIAKLTESVIQNTIKLQPEYDRIYQELVRAKFDLDMAQAAVRAIDHKKSALENLVRLHGQSYFAGPSVPRDLSEEVLRSQKQKRSDSRIAEKMKRKKKED